MLLVLVCAARVIPPGAVRQQDGQVEGVVVGQRVRVERRHAPHEGRSHLGDVVEVSTNKVLD